jgi:hypothetical protein
MYQKGDRVRVDPMEDDLTEILNRGLSLDQTYVVEDVFPADEDPWGYRHDEAICLREEPGTTFFAKFFVPA